MAFTPKPLSSRYASTARVVRSAFTRPMPVTPMPTFFPAMVPAKNLRPLKTPTSVTGAAAARSFAPSVGYAERMRTRALPGQAARTAGGKSAPAATPAATARWTILATNRLADVTCRRRFSIPRPPAHGQRVRTEARPDRAPAAATPVHDARQDPISLVTESRTTGP